MNIHIARISFTNITNCILIISWLAIRVITDAKNKLKKNDMNLWNYAGKGEKKKKE